MMLKPMMSVCHWHRQTAVLCAAALVMIMGGCAASRQSHDQGEAERQDVSHTHSSELAALDVDEEHLRADGVILAQNHFIIARDYERRGMRAEALRYYEIARVFDPSAQFLRQKLLDIYMRTEEHEKALALFGDLSDPSALSLEDRRTVSQLYLRLDQIGKAAEMIEALGPDRTEEEAYSLAILYEMTGRKDKALSTFKDFFENNPHAVGLGIRLIQFNITERRLEEARNLAAVLRGAFPDNAEAVSLLGTVHYIERDTASAVKYFNEALTLDPLNRDALSILSHIHILKGEYEEAVAHYRRLVTIEESGGNSYRRGLATLLYHIKAYEESEALLDELISEALSGAPERVAEALDARKLREIFTRDRAALHELYLYRGLVYSKTDRREKAAREFETVVSADPNNEDAWRELCYLHIIDKNYERAISAVDRYQKAFPQSGAGHRLRAYALNIDKKREEAIEALKKAISIDSLDYFSWFELGSTFERMKRIDDAADAFRVVLRIRPGDAAASNYLGYMWADANMNIDSAKILIEAALKKEPKNSAYLDSYAWVFYRLGDYEKAHYYMKEAFANMGEDDKPDPVLYEHMGDVLFKLGEYKNAEAAYNRALELKTEDTDVEKINARILEIKTLRR